MKGKLIVFEGCDGVGKSTLSAMTAARLQSSGLPVYQLPFPGKTPGTLGGTIYDLHHGSSLLQRNPITPAALQCLHIAAHLDSLETVIKPAIDNGETVILDRFWWSTHVYGTVAGADRAVLKKLIKAEIAAWGNLRPSYLFVIDRDKPLREEPLNEWNAWKKEYHLLIATEADKYPIHVIENKGIPSEAADQIIQIVNQSRMPRKRTSPKRFQFELNLLTEQQNAPVRQVSNSSPSSSACKAWAPLTPTGALDTYWKFAVARQEVFFKRFEGQPPPWSTDSILVENKFTNAYRASDRVSQYLIKNVIYEGDQNPEEVFFRTILFKFFNKIETWQLLQSSLNEVSWRTFSVTSYDKILENAISKGNRIYSAAYIMPTGGRGTAFNRKHMMHLHLLESMMRDQVWAKIQKTGSMEKGFSLLRNYPSIGDFLAYQYITDVNYSEIVDYDEMEFVVPGPGAIDGISKCFSNAAGYSEKRIIELMTKRQKSEFERLGLEFRDLWGRPLQLIDCQNLFCEVGKYARLAHPDIKGSSGRTRIKQKFRSSAGEMPYWYPPKWGINEKIEKTY